MQFWRLAVGTSTIVDVRRLKVNMLGCVLEFPVDSTPSAETCRSFNNCYELYFIKCICLWMYWFSVRLISISCAHSDRRILCKWAHITYMKI